MSKNSAKTILITFSSSAVQDPEPLWCVYLSLIDYLFDNTVQVQRSFQMFKIELGRPKLSISAQKYWVFKSAQSV